MHPSWRDLVIEQLAADPEARRRFLARCEVPGAMLALSTAGGRSGERRLPLLRDDRDWDALADRLYVLAGECDEPALIALLAALGAVLEDLGDSPGGGEVAALARCALSRAARRWDTAQVPVAVGPLEAWFDVARRLDPRPESPSLDVTWAELLPARSPPLDDPTELERFADWLALSRVLWDGQSEVWRTLTFGPRELGLLLDFMDAVGRRRTPPAHLAVVRALDAIPGIVPQLTARSHRLARHCRGDDDEPRFYADEPIAREDAGGELFDVRRVLADL